MFAKIHRIYDSKVYPSGWVCFRLAPITLFKVGDAADVDEIIRRIEAWIEAGTK